MKGVFLSQPHVRIIVMTKDKFPAPCQCGMLGILTKPNMFGLPPLHTIKAQAKTVFIEQNLSVKRYSIANGLDSW